MEPGEGGAEGTEGARVILRRITDWRDFNYSNILYYTIILYYILLYVLVVV